MRGWDFYSKGLATAVSDSKLDSYRTKWKIVQELDWYTPPPGPDDNFHEMVEDEGPEFWANGTTMNEFYDVCKIMECDPGPMWVETRNKFLADKPWRDEYIAKVKEILGEFKY